MDNKAIEKSIEDLVSGMLSLIAMVWFVSPIMGVFFGSALKLGMWLGGFGILPFGRAFVLGWVGTFAWVLINMLVEKLRPIKIG